MGRTGPRYMRPIHAKDNMGGEKYGLAKAMGSSPSGLLNWLAANLVGEDKRISLIFRTLTVTSKLGKPLESIILLSLPLLLDGIYSPYSRYYVRGVAWKFYSL